MNPWQKLTLMENFGDVISELSKKYKNSFVKITNGSSVYVGRVCQIDSNKVWIRDKYNTMLNIQYNTDQLIETLTLAPGLYNWNDDVWFGYYTGARQYRKSINSDSFKFHHPLYHQVSDSLEAVFDAIKPKYPKNIWKAINTINIENLNGIAVNRNFGICKHKDNLYYVYRDAVIGEIVDKTINIHNKHFNQEVMDSFRYIDYSGYEVNYG